MADEIPAPDRSSFLTINKQNFKDVIDNEKLLFAKFYVDECQLCQAFLEDFRELDKRLTAESIPPMKTALIDEETHSELMAECLVNHDGHYILFRNGFPAFLSGESRNDDVLAWIRTKLNSPVKNVETIQEVEELLLENDALVIGFFKDVNSLEAQAYCNVAYFLENKVFRICSDDGLRNKLKAENNSVMVLKRGSEEHEKFFKGSVCEEELISFVNLYTTPIIAEYRKHKQRIELLKAHKLHLFIFMTATSGHKRKYYDILKEIALEYRDRLLFVIADSEEDDIYDMYECFGLELWETPRFRLIQWYGDGNPAVKYKPDIDEISAENVRNFLNSYFAGNLTRYYPSQRVPKDWDSYSVTELVGENFDEVVFDTTKLVVVFFYHPDLVQSLWLEHDYDQIAELFEQKRDDIKITRINMKANELEHTVIRELPTVRLYTAGDNKMIELVMTPTYENLLLFIDSEGEYNEPEPADEYDSNFGTKVCYYHH